MVAMVVLLVASVGIGLAAVLLGAGVMKDRDLSGVGPVLDHVRGRPVLEELHPIPPTAENDFERIEIRTTFEGLLPKRIRFAYYHASREDGGPVPVLDRHSLFAVLLFGDLLAHLAPESSITASAGDLVIRSAPAPKRSTDAVRHLHRRLANAADPVTLPNRVHTMAERGDTLEAKIAATEVFLEIAPDDDRVPALLQQAAEDPNDELRALAAARSPATSRAILIAIADDPTAPPSARARAVSALVAARDRDAIVGLRLHPVPGAARGAVVDLLRSTRDTAHEEAVRSYLATDARAGAIDALAVLGTRDSVEPLRQLLRAGTLEEKEAVGAEIAIELIQGRLKEGAGENRGGLALADAEAPPGALSMPGSELHGLSYPEGRGKKK